MENQIQIEYTLTMDSELAKTCLNAVETLMRLKLNQPEFAVRTVLEDMYEEIGCDEFCRRRDKADLHIKDAFQEIFPTWKDVKKDDVWYRLYNIYQVLRYQIHLAENPNSTGVDSHPPMKFTDVHLPKGSWKKIGQDASNP